MRKQREGHQAKPFCSSELETRLVMTSSDCILGLRIFCVFLKLQLFELRGNRLRF